jgi:choline dehydrogenase-like flavoprotein
MGFKSGTQITGLEVRTEPGHAFTVEASLYVLAAGGVETPRLLLASRTRTHPRGIGNEYDLVGRYFMEHPHYACGRLVPSTQRAFADKPSYDITMADDLPVQVKYSLCDALMEREGLNRTVFRLEAKPLSESNHTLRYPDAAVRSLEAAASLRQAVAKRDVRAVDPRALPTALFGPHHLARHALNQMGTKLRRRATPERYAAPQQFWMRAMAEQTPNRDSRVRLIEEQDRMGVPKVVVDWKLAERDLDSMRRSQTFACKALLDAGHREVESLVEDRALPPALSGGNHHMGTTRMHDTPQRGVVDQHGRVHGLANLYVSGSSTFPTSGYANPTLTVLALALRLADVLRSRLR